MGLKNVSDDEEDADEKEVIYIVCIPDLHHSVLFSFMTLRYGEGKGFNSAFALALDLYVKLLDSEEAGFKPHVVFSNKKYYVLDFVRNSRYPHYKKIWIDEIYQALYIPLEDEMEEVLENALALGRHSDASSLGLLILRLMHFFNEMNVAGVPILFAEAKQSGRKKISRCQDTSAWLFPTVN